MKREYALSPDLPVEDKKLKSYINKKMRSLGENIKRSKDFRKKLLGESKSLEAKDIDEQTTPMGIFLALQRSIREKLGDSLEKKGTVNRAWAGTGGGVGSSKLYFSEDGIEGFLEIMIIPKSNGIQANIRFRRRTEENTSEKISRDFNLKATVKSMVFGIRKEIEDLI